MQDNYIYPALPGLSEYAIFFVKNWGQLKTNARFSKQFHLGASAALLALLGRHSHRSTAPLCPQSHRRTFQTNPIKDGLQIQTNTNTNTPKQINCSTLPAKPSLTFQIKMIYKYKYKKHPNHNTLSSILAFENQKQLTLVPVILHLQCPFWCLLWVNCIL